MSLPAGLPDFFVDRSLGRKAVPELLRTAGLTVVTLAERYGIPTDETITDETRLADAGRQNEAMLAGGLVANTVRRWPADPSTSSPGSSRPLTAARPTLSILP